MSSWSVATGSVGVTTTIDSEAAPPSAVWIVRKLLVDARSDRVGSRRRNQERVAVGGSLRGEARTDRSAGPGAVVDDDGLAQRTRERIRDHAGDQVRVAADAERDDQPDRSRGVGLRRYGDG